MADTLIIGAGISGLTAAWGLQQAGQTVQLLECSGRVGGAIQSECVDGFLIESGPNTLMVGKHETWQALQRMGLEECMLEPGAAGKKRYIVRHGRPVAAPMTPREGLASPLFSIGGKFRVLGDLAVRRPRGLMEESVAAFVRRRVGSEFLDYAINPFVGGVFAGDPERLSLQHAFPKMAALEAQHGSLIAGALAKMREKKDARKRGEPAFKPRMISFEGGMQTLPATLAGHLGESLTLNCRIEGIRQQAGRWEVRWACGEACADRLVLAVPAHALAQLPLPESLRSQLELLADIPHPPVTTLYLGYKRSQIGHPLDGFGALVPQKEQRKLLGVLFSSSLFPGRAPAEHAGLTVFLGGTRQPELASLSEAQQVAIAADELSALLNVQGPPVLVRRTFWPRAIPQYIVGYDRFLKAIEQAEGAHPGLHLLGNYRGGISVSQCLENALKAPPS